MDKNSLASIMAALLPVLLGLGLIDMYVSREASFGLIAAALIALAIVMILIAALNDLAAGRPQRRRRSRARTGR